MTTGLLIVDLQNDYFPGGRFPLAGIEFAAANARRLLVWARAEGCPVFHIRHENASSDAPFFLKGDKGAEIHSMLAPIDGEFVVTKHHVNCYRGTPLLDLLRSRSVDELVICGAMSHMCVDAAVRASADLGFSCTVVHDACATCDLEFGSRRTKANDVHAAFMSALNGAYAAVVSIDDRTVPHSET